MNAREFLARLAGLFRRRRPDSDLDDEMATHLELAAAENMAKGMSPAEARRQAAIRFGSVGLAREDVWQQGWLPGPGSFLQDARYALRTMRNSPGFTLTAILTVSLGIALCSMMFTILNSYLLRPLSGVPNPEPLAMVQEMATYPQFEKWRDHSGAASSMAALIGPAPFGVEAGGQRTRVMGQLVSPEYFATLGVEPQAGRFFGADARGGAQVVVTDRFWRLRLHADPQAVGRTLEVNGRPATIVGIGPKDFFGVGTGITNVAELFVPLHADPLLAPELSDDVLHRTTAPAFRVIMRLPPDMSLVGAEARLDAQARDNDRREQKKGRSVRLMPAGTAVPIPTEGRVMVGTFYGFLFALILLMMSANLGGLLLARGSARAKEIAIRLSIGAGRGRLLRQLLTESVVLAGLGGAIGLATGYALLHAVISTWGDANAIPFVQRPEMDWRVAAFAFLLSTAAAMGFGLAPALAVTRPDVASALKTAPGTGTALRSRRFRLRNLFIVCQMAAAMMLVMIMGFVMLGMRAGLKREAGFDTARLSLFSLDPPRDGLTRNECEALFARLPDDLMKAPGVESVALADRAPLSDARAGTPVSVLPLESGSPEAVRLVSLQRVGDRYFSTLGAPLLRGSDFQTHSSSAAMPPAILNQTAARDLFGTADPVGRRIRYEEDMYQVVGVARYDPPMVLLNRPVPTVFLPLTDYKREAMVVVRWRAQPDLPGLRKEVAAIDGRLSVMRDQSLQALLTQSEQANRVIAAFYVPIGGFGLVLACVGLAGVTAQAVQRRRKEIGIRMALGAQRRQLLRLVMKEGALMMAVGAACGFAGAYGMARVLAASFAPVAEVIGAGGGNPVLLIGVPGLLISLAVIACYVPARRSATVDPLLALREE